MAWGDYHEPSHQGSEARIELVAGLLATQPLGASTPASDADVQRIFDEIDHVVDVGFLFNLTMPRTDDAVADTLRFTSATRWMTVRGSSYEHHGVDLATQIYEPQDRWLLANLGFTVGDMIAVGRTFDSVITRRVNRIRREAGEYAAELLKIGQAHLENRRFDAETARRFLLPEGRKSIQARAFIDVVQGGIRDAMTLSAEEIQASNPSLDGARVRALLSALSIDVGSLDERLYTGLFDESPFRERPLLGFKDRFALPVPGMMTRDAVTVLERRLVEGQPSFPSSRAKTLDRLAVGYLSALMPGSRSYTNLEYEGTELDGLVLFDDIAAVVEGKGSALSVPGQRGDLRRLDSELGEIIDTAALQGARARDYLLDGDISRFADEHGSVVLEVAAGQIQEVFVITPTAHDLAGHSVRLDRPAGIGPFPDGRYPWSVFINDLRVIAETCENAAVFLHYLSWRSRLPLGQRVVVGDELDLWVSYLLAERFPMAGFPDGLIVGNSSTDLDAHYEGVLGRGPRRPAPKKFLPEILRSFVDRMATARPKGWRTAAGVCLDLSIPELAFVDVRAGDVAVAAAREREVVIADVDRLVLVGLPSGADPVETLRHLDLGSSDPSFVLAVTGRTRSKARVMAAEPRKAVTFELSPFEEAVFGAAASGGSRSDE